MTTISATANLQAIFTYPFKNPKGKFLRELGYDVVTASELGLSRAEDESLLREAQK